MTDWNGTTSYEYHANGQISRVTSANGQTLRYTWTKLGQKKSMGYPTGDTVRHEYDANGNLVKVTDTSHGVTVYTYNELNQVKTKQLPNGAESSYAYDKAGWLKKRVESGNSPKETYEYEYDKNGNRTKETKTAAGGDPAQRETTQYTYDGLNQLTGVTDQNGTRTYVYDEFQNRIRKEDTEHGVTVYEYDERNQLVKSIENSKTTRTYQYDKQGNLARVEEDGEFLQSYTFDSTGMLAEVAGNAEGDSSVLTTYTYDGLGNRTKKEVEQGGRTAEEICYLADPESACGDIIWSQDSITGETCVYTYGKEVICVETEGETRYYRSDEKKSVTEILDEKGNQMGTLRYDEFGRLENPEEGTTKGILFAYTGYGYEERTGLYDAKARYYDAETGRFLSEDQYYGTPMEPANQNRYVYVRNNPLKYTDPSGNVILESAMVTLVFIIAGVAVSYMVTVGYLKTEKGKLLLNNAKKVIYDGTTYLKDKFKKIISGIGEQVKKGFEAFDKACKELIDLFSGASKKSGTKKKSGSNGKGQANSVAVGVSGNTITVGDKRYRCDTKAEEIAQSMSRNKHIYYPAMRMNNQIYVAPISISRKVALAIMSFNNDRAGVFAVSNKYAKGLCISLGGADGPEGEARSGYWMHYHGKACRKAHCWFIGN